MEHHPYFDLWLHSTEELSTLLEIEVVERTTLHEWPLSCVQLLRLADDRRIIYKTQSQEGVEPEFYRRVQSPLLPWHRSLGLLNTSETLLFEYIDAPLLENLPLSEAEILAHGRSLLHALRQVDDHAPVYCDLGSAEKWLVLVEEALNKLARLIAGRKFHLTRPEMIGVLEAWARSAAALAAIETGPCLVHADLSGDNIFVTPAGYKVIDWQFARRAPAALDWVGFLDGQGIDPLRYADPASVGVFWFVRLAWFVECKTRLFPQGKIYDQQVAELAKQISGLG